MFNDINTYFHESIWDTYQKYVKTKKDFKAGLSNDLRSAINLGTMLFHLREHIPQVQRKTRKALGIICPDYNLLGDIVNASKHGTLTDGNTNITTADQIYEQIISTEYKDRKGIYRHVEKSVFVRLNNGYERDLHEVIINVLNMWLSELHGLGIIKQRGKIEKKTKGIPRRNKDSGKINLQGVSGVGFKKTFRFQRYNYQTKQVEPIDLTGKDFKMQIYKPSYTLNLKGRDDDTGREIDIKVKIDEKQKKQFEKMKSDNERLLFLMTLAKEQGKITSFDAK